MINLKSLTARVYRAPVDTPVRTSFGTMHDRPMVLVEAEDREGCRGWGEIWCNYPHVGAEHRARLLDSVMSPLATARSFVGPEELFRHLTEATSVLAVQCAEPGPFAQAIAGVDIAAWDLAARKAGLPLWRFLGGEAPTIRVYASGLNPTSPEELARRKYGEGYRAFKLKIGFGAERDIANLQALRDTLGADVDLMADANQGWTVDEAVAIAPRLEQFDLRWLEEPVRADQPWKTWGRLHAATSLPLAAGENILGLDAFERALGAKVLSVVQPDLAKWGGISGCRQVARRINVASATYCPHYLGGGIGLVASAHLLAAVGGSGRLEVDANANPLRTLLCGPVDDVKDGWVTLDDAAGLGIVPDLSALARFLVPH